jgi:hypothetical protein
LWHEFIKKIILSVGFLQSRYDPGLYYHRDSDKLSLLALHVDDFLTCDETGIMQKFDAALAAAGVDFTIVTPATSFVGIAITQTDGAVKLSAPAAIDVLVRDYRVTGAARTPYYTWHCYTRASGGIEREVGFGLLANDCWQP